VLGIADELGTAQHDLPGQVRDGQEQRGSADLQAYTGCAARGSPAVWFIGALPGRAG